MYVKIILKNLEAAENTKYLLLSVHLYAVFSKWYGNYL